jgi:hypothetical protein
MAGGAIGWLYRDIYKEREDPDITVINGSSEDNPHIPREELERMKRKHEGDPMLRARLYGEFVHLGGVVYEGGFDRVLMSRDPNPEDTKNWDVVVGMDPGLKNAAFIWVGFDSDNVAYVFDEVLLNEKTPEDYVRAIHQTNAKWGVSPTYVIDPSARNRSLVNAESVEANLQRSASTRSTARTKSKPASSRSAPGCSTGVSGCLPNAGVSATKRRSTGCRTATTANSKSSKSATTGSTHFGTPACTAPGTR